MRFENDFEDFIKTLNKNEVKYCIIGCMAAALYGQPRHTGDIDILVEASLENSKKTRTAILDFGINTSELEPEYFSKPGNLYQIGVEPVQIHITTKIDGVDFKDVWKHKNKYKYGNEPAYYISLDDLIKNKESLNRPKDKEDLIVLKKMKDKTNE
jgi:hypothetical protein